MNRMQMVTGWLLTALVATPAMAAIPFELLSSSARTSSASAGTFQIANSGSTTTATRVQMEFYSSADCSTGYLGFFRNPTDGGYLFSPNTNVKISAEGVYVFGNNFAEIGDMSPVQSVLILPLYNRGSNIVFNEGPCFPVSCATGACVGTGTVPVTLDNTASATAIGSFDDFKAWNGEGNAYLTADITINDTSYSSLTDPYSLSSGQIFDGKGFTVTVDNGESSFRGLFKLAGGTIQHLNLTITSGSLAASSGWLAYGANLTSVSGAYGIIYNTNVTATGRTMGTSSGGIVGARASVASDGSSYVIGTSTNNLTIADCKYTGPFPNAGGGILGKFASNITNSNDGTSGGGVILIKGCFVNITASGSNGGGITGSFMAKNYTGANNIIQQSIVTGAASGNSTGGFVGTDGYCDITNSYSLYNIEGRTSSGVFYHQKSHGSIATSYYLGSSSGSFISSGSIGSPAVTITNCATSGTTF